MILLDVLDAERRKGGPNSSNPAAPTRRNTDSSSLASTSSEVQLPDYDTSQAQIEKRKLGETDDVAVVELAAVKKHANWRERRMTRWIIWALAIYLVLSLAIAIPLFIVLRNNAREDEYKQQGAFMAGPDGGPPIPPSSKELPPDISTLPSVFGTSLECNDWTLSATDNTYRLQYSLPVNESLYIRSNYTEQEGVKQSPMAGTFNVNVASDTTQQDAIVSVSMNNIGDDALQATNVCTVRTEVGWGLAIYVPNDGIARKYQFDVDLTLPIPSGEMFLQELATYLPSFNQSFGSLDAYAGIPSFVVQGSSASINVESVHADAILVKTSAAEITGTFNASGSCFLETVLAPISANVSLYNEGGYCPPTQLEVETGNSDITLNVTLYGFANATDYKPPFFLSGATTYSGNVQATYRHDSQLLASRLYVSATSSMDPAAVFVDSTYQGTYDVHTSLADANVYTDSSLPDPSGLGRARTFDDEFVSTSRRYGWVNWGPQPNDGRIQGHIEVQSSLSDAILQLTDAPDPNVLNGSSNNLGNGSWKR